MRSTFTAVMACAAAAGLLAWSSPATPAAALGQGQFATETDNVVWANLRSKVYHASGSKAYGKSKRGVYMCEKEATVAGFRAPKPPRSGKA
jgi:hypothetical protein